MGCGGGLSVAGRRGLWSRRVVQTEELHRLFWEQTAEAAHHVDMQKSEKGWCEILFPRKGSRILRLKHCSRARVRETSV